MKLGFYPRLAVIGIRKNKQMYLPYILTCIGMVTMFYIIMFLALSDSLDSVPGSETLHQIFALGSWVIVVFAAFFLLYTNSFLLRRRKREFGLYHILGMGKGNIGRVLLWETIITAVISIGIGLLAGIGLSKLSELGLVNVMHGTVTYDLTISWLAVIRSAQVFGVIYLLLLFNAIRQVWFASAISLVRSENAGEKPPKGNWLVGMAGVLILAAAYYLAVTIQDPMTALVTFFVAVIMVIVGTYLVMIAGSVWFCRFLQRNRNYYYRTNHFISVSSMVYRMKRNGAGLASICILATMVLVMMASTACLYFGEENAIESRFPRDINLKFRMEEVAGLSDDRIRALKDEVLAELANRHIEPTNDYAFRSACISGVLEGDLVELETAKIEAVESVTKMRYFYLVPLEDYNAVMGTSETLEEGEALLFTYQEDFEGEKISFHNGNTFHIKRRVGQFVENGDTQIDRLSSMILIVPNLEKSVRSLSSIADFNGDRQLQMSWIYNFDVDLEPEQEVELYRELDDFYGVFGTLFYLGVILSIVFLIAAVLLIYYKQMLEGYEDQARFEIMQKLGMTRQEIRRSINSQLLTVFFLPLVFAAMHLAFAFPLIRKILLAFNLNNVLLFAATTGVSILVFAVFYMIVYRLTSNAYYRLVSEGGK